MTVKRKSATAQLSASSDDSDRGDPERIIIEEGGIKIGDVYIPPPPPPVCSLDTGAPRLIIVRIVNKNFKSYAGVQELGPFHKCFTSIIGPNGSGKSNVIDSMLFVFGYRGSKIRTKKISSLIHNSENHKNIQSCTVSVYFKLIIDKDEDYDEVPNSQFYISRTGFKDNTSIYEIDGRRVPFKEVAIKLKKYGIDLDHNRFLILQGEVEQIALMKPKGVNEHDSGMLEYLEDIIGTSRFKEPIEQLHVIVGALNEDRAAKVQKVELVGKEKNDMLGAYQEAINFLKTENYIIELRNTEYQKYIYDTELNKAQKEEKRNEIKNELESKVEMIKEFVKKRKELEDQLKGKYEEKSQLEESVQNLKDLYKQIETKDNSAKADMIQTNDRRKKAKDKLAEEKKKLIELEKVPESNTADIKEIEKKLPKLVEEKEILETKKQGIIAEIAKLTKPLQDQRYVKESELIKLRENENKAKTDLNIAETQLKVFLQNETTAIQTLEKIRTTYENSQKTLKEKQKLVEENKKVLPVREKELDKANKELLQLNNESKRIQEQIYSLSAKIEEARSSMQQAQYRNRVLNYLMQLKNEGVLPGILGRLGDLGAINPKYDVAVSTACGPLDYIVVDTIETANKCVDVLKTKNIGRGNFMPLDKLEYLRQHIQQRVQTPENIPRLFDLIQIKDERLITPFYYGVRETLVANDLEQATRIAYGQKRYRVVTLNGDLIEVVGTMSGGGRTQISGRMGSKILVDTTSNPTETPEKIEKYERDVKKLSENLQDMNNNKYELERTVDQLTNEVEKMRIDLRKFVTECEAIQINLPSLQKQIIEQEKIVQSTVSDKNCVKELKSTIEAKRQLFEKENKIAGKLQEEVDELSKQISSKDGGKLLKVQNSIKDITQNIDKLKSETTRLTVGIKNAERNTIKCKNNIERIEESIHNYEETILKLQEERNEIEVDAKKLVEKIEKVEKELNQFKCDGEDTKMKNEINELNKNEHKLKEDKINLEHELNTIDKTIKDYVNNLSHWRKALSRLTLHDIPNNEVEIELLENTLSTSKANHQNVTINSLNSSSSTTNQKKELRKLTDDELENCNVADIQYTITFQQDKLSKKPNLNVIEEYKKVQLEYCKRVREVEEVTQQRKMYRDTLDKAKKQRETEFLTGYQIINLKLKEMYQMITLGGDAELELVDSLDPFNDGISFSVRPPKKSWKNICNLSGGEKTLSSLALVFALHYYKPSPLYVMDEIDAALDFKNVSIVGNYIKDRTKNAQFIIISLRSNMFELADRLVGIYKTYNCTKSCSVNPAGLHEILLNSLNSLQIVMPTNLQVSQAIVLSQQTQLQTQTSQMEKNNQQVSSTIIQSQSQQTQFQTQPSQMEQNDESTSQVSLPLSQNNFNDQENNPSVLAENVTLNENV